MSRSAISIQTSITLAPHAPNETTNVNLRNSLPLLLECRTQLYQVLTGWVLPLYTSSQHIPYVFYGGEVRGHCRPGQGLDLVPLEMVKDDACMMSSGIVIFVDESSSMTECKRKHKWSDDVVTVVHPCDSPMAHVEVSPASHSDSTPHHY